MLYQLAHITIADICFGAGRFLLGTVVGALVVAPDGRGVRFGSDGSFLHFLEP